jgi:hypothetical protein
MFTKGLLIRISICIMFFGICLYSYIDRHNNLTALKMKVPHLVKEIVQINQEINMLQYEVDQFESPLHLMELARHPEYSHLKHPLIEDILTIEEGVALHESDAITTPDRG